VLSPKSRMHSWVQPTSSHSSSTSQIVMTIARNSRKLLAIQSPCRGEFFGTISLQALLDQVNPPSPNGQESDIPTRHG